MANHKTSKPKLRQICNLYNKGYSYPYIMKKLHVATMTIQNTLKANNIKIRPKGGTYRKYNFTKNKLIRLLNSNEGNVYKTSKVVGCHVTRLYEAIKTLKLKKKVIAKWS